MSVARSAGRQAVDAASGALDDLVQPMRGQAVCFLLNGSRRRLIGRLDQAADVAADLVDPVVLVVDPVLALDLEVSFVGRGDVGCLHAGKIMLVHVERDRSTPFLPRQWGASRSATSQDRRRLRG